MKKSNYINKYLFLLLFVVDAVYMLISNDVLVLPSRRQKYIKLSKKLSMLGYFIYIYFIFDNLVF